MAGPAALTAGVPGPVPANSELLMEIGELVQTKSPDGFPRKRQLVMVGWLVL